MGNKSKPSSQNGKMNPYEQERLETLQAYTEKIKARGFNKSMIDLKYKDYKKSMISFLKNIVLEECGSEELLGCQLEKDSVANRREQSRLKIPNELQPVLLVIN